MYIYGPYLNNRGRKIVILIFPNGKRKTITFAKLLMQIGLNRSLDSDKETVDHFDGTKENDDIQNLRILPREEHSRQDTRRTNLIELECPICKKTFSKTPRYLREKHNKGNAGPFCSRSCASKASMLVRLKKLKKFKIQPYIETEYYKDKNENM